MALYRHFRRQPDVMMKDNSYHTRPGEGVSEADMYKKYEIKFPLFMYLQVISYSIVSLLMLKLVFIVDSFLLTVFFTFLILVQAGGIAVLIARMVRRNSELEITPNKIRINRKEVSKEDIEKIIVDDSFTQSIGIKRYGKRLIPMDLHFRFRNKKETNLEELTVWARENGVEVTRGKIFRWI